MKWWILTGVALATFLATPPGIAVAQSVSPVIDIGAEVRGIFAAKCAGCHGPNLVKPKGRFDYVLDLQRIAENPEMVIPSSPDESELWILVSRDEMPQPDSPTGPLSLEQKVMIRAWIAAGAPAPSSTDPGIIPLPETTHPESVPRVSKPSIAKQALVRLGNFHVVVVHFPIALLIAAAVGELSSAWHGRRSSTPAVHFCVLLGTAGALAAACLGWLHAWNGHGVGMALTLSLHRWFGTVAAVWAIGTAVFSEREQRRGVRSQWFLAWLLIGALLTTVAAHFGGTLVHGKDFLTHL